MNFYSSKRKHPTPTLAYKHTQHRGFSTIHVAVLHNFTEDQSHIKYQKRWYSSRTLAFFYTFFLGQDLVTFHRFTISGLCCWSPTYQHQPIRVLVFVAGNSGHTPTPTKSRSCQISKKTRHDSQHVLVPLARIRTLPFSTT